MANTLYIVRGIPGSGKSTFAKKMFTCPIFENDMYFIKDGKYLYNQVKMRDAISWCMESVELALKYGCDVVVANTFTKRKYVQAYKNLAEKNSAQVKVFRMYGDFKNVHDVPDHVFNNMRDNFEDWSDEICVYPNINQDEDDPCFRPYIMTQLKVGDKVEFEVCKDDEFDGTINSPMIKRIGEVTKISQGTYDYLNITFFDKESQTLRMALPGDLKKVG